jgi:hypothetical protein
MTIDQISIFLENKEGRIAEIGKLLAGGDVDIRALSIADTDDFGILRIIVNKPKEALKILRENGITVSITKVIAIGIDDKPGSFANIMAKLSDNHIGVEYMYAFISRDKEKAFIILRVDNNDKAIKVLKENNVELLTTGRLISI